VGLHREKMLESLEVVLARNSEADRWRLVNQYDNATPKARLYLEGPTIIRQPLLQDCLDDDYGPQVSPEFGGEGQGIEWALDHFCVHVSFSGIVEGWGV
jgi:hypothetical protein